MGTDIAKKAETGLLPGMPGPGVRAQWEDLVDTLRSYYKDASNEEFQFFLHYCRSMGLDPIRKQIHLITRTVDRGTKEERKVSTIQIGIDGFRAISARTGEYAGVDDYRYDEGLTIYQMIAANRDPVTATATVYRIVRGARVPFTHTCAWKEYVPMGKQAFMWHQMKFNQIGKCAEACAHRKGFPEQFPRVYSEEELAHLVDEIEEAPKTTLMDVPKLKIAGPDPHPRVDPPAAEAAKPAETPKAEPPKEEPKEKQTDDDLPAGQPEFAAVMAATRAKKTTLIEMRAKLRMVGSFTKGQARKIVEALK